MTSAWHNVAIPLCVSRPTSHGTNIDTTPNMLETRLVTIMTVTVCPHPVAVIPIAPSSHFSTNITTEQIEVIENPLLYIKQPHLCILDTLDKFYDRGQSKYITLAANISDEELRINKGITICFTHVAHITEIHCDAKPAESVNEVNDIDVETKESAISEAVPKETLTPIPQNSSFMFHKDFYPQTRIMVLDTDLSDEESIE